MPCPAPLGIPPWLLMAVNVLGRVTCPHRNHPRGTVPSPPPCHRCPSGGRKALHRAGMLLEMSALIADFTSAGLSCALWQSHCS